MVKQIRLHYLTWTKERKKKEGKKKKTTLRICGVSRYLNLGKVGLSNWPINSTIYLMECDPVSTTTRYLLPTFYLHEMPGNPALF